MHRDGNCQLSEGSMCSDSANIYSYRTIMHNSQCTYLNSGLLVAPSEYVLHGLALGVYWTRLWPLLTSMHLVATPDPVYSCLWQRFKFHPNVFCSLGGFSLMYVQVNITTTKYDTWRTLIYITLQLPFIHIILLHTSSILLGRLAVLRSLCLLLCCTLGVFLWAVPFQSIKMYGWG